MTGFVGRARDLWPFWLAILGFSGALGRVSPANGSEAARLSTSARFMFIAMATN